MARLGIRIENDPRLKVDDLVSVARAAEAAGFESIWVPEASGRDAISMLATFAAATESVKLCTGILPIFSRTPAATAMAAFGLDTVSDGRFVLGLGSGHGPVVAATHGIPYTAPLARMEETVLIAGDLLKGERVTVQGKHFETKGAQLDRVPKGVTVPIYVAALGPRMTRLAGRLADGVLFNWTPLSHIEHAVSSLRGASEAEGRDRSAVDVAGYVRIAVTDEASEGDAREALQRQVAGYARNPHYRDFFAATGFKQEMAQAGEAYSSRDYEGAALAISRHMQQEVAVIGAAEECREEVSRRRALGLGLPVLAPFAASRDMVGAYHQVIEAFGNER